MVRRVRAGALLVLTLLLPALLAGCHGVGDPIPTDGPPAPPPADPKADPVPIDNPLPPFHLTKSGEGRAIALHVQIDGDPASIAHHELTWGDGKGFDARPGAPAARYTHTFPQPSHWRADPATFTPRLTLYSSAGHTRTATTPIEVPPAPNTPPAASLLVHDPPVAVPARTTIAIQAHDSDGTIRSWTLDPGDGSPPLTDHEAPPDQIVHVYRRIGHHTATLTITDDAGATQTAETEIFVPPPQDHLIWTLSKTNGTLYQHAPDGTITTTRAPFGVCHEAPCDRIVGAAAHSDTLAVLIDHGTESSVRFVDGSTGRPLHSRTLPPAPQGLYADPDGRYWTTHGDGTITWSRASEGAPLGTVTLPAVDAELRLAFGPDGVAWALVSDATARLYRIDPIDGRASLLFLPIPTEATHLAVNHKHHQAVVVDIEGRAWTATPTPWGPVLMRVTQLPGSAPTAAVCAAAGDLCWAVLSAPTARLAPIDLRVQPSATDDREGIPLGGGGTPVGAGVHHGLVVVAMDGSDPRILVIDGETGATLHTEKVASTGVFLGHPTHPTLVYHAHRDGRWGILDLELGREVHQAPDAGGRMGPYLTARPWQPATT